MTFLGRWCGVALACALALAPAQAGAQRVLDPSTALACDSVAYTFCSAPDVPCGTDATCRERPDGSHVCVPDRGFLCCSDHDRVCYTDEAGDPVTCQAVSGLVGVETGLCLPRVEWCRYGDGDLSVTDVLDNLTASDGTVSTTWANGDADRDELSNGEEERIGTDPCLEPRPRGFWDGEGGCVEIPVGCPLGAECTVDGVTTTCQTDEDGLGTECAPDLYEVAWCGYPFACVSDQVEDDDDESGPRTGQFWCVPDDCRDYADSIDLADCNLQGTDPVPWADGDCDGDGSDNDSDEDVCVPRLDDGDGGVLPGVDAGPGRDGGGPNDLDGGSGDPDQEVRFGGGGGCRCRATPTGERGAPLALLALLGLALARRRR